MHCIWNGITFDSLTNVDIQMPWNINEMKECKCKLTNIVYSNETQKEKIK